MYEQLWLADEENYHTTGIQFAVAEHPLWLAVEENY